MNDEIKWKEERKKPSQPMVNSYDEFEYVDEFDEEGFRRETVFGEGSGWFRATDYTIKTIDSIETITPSDDAKIMYFKRSGGVSIWYDPLSVTPPEKQPKTAEDEDQFWGPHLHLARIDLNSEDDILGFVKKWGLLGLWWQPFYKDYTPIVKPKKMTKTLFNEFSSYYYNDDPNKPALLRYQEPLMAFILAAESFQEIAGIFSSNPVNKDQLVDARTKINTVLKNVSPHVIYNPENESTDLIWSFGNLYQALFLLLVFKPFNPLGYSQCAYKQCRKIFQVKYKRDRYCSSVCDRNQRRLDSYYRKKKKNKTKEQP